MLGLPDEIYQYVGQHYITHDLWQALASLHRDDELQLITGEMTEKEIFFQLNPLTNILCVLSSLDHQINLPLYENGTFTYSKNDIIFTPENEPVLVATNNSKSLTERVNHHSEYDSD